MGLCNISRKHLYLFVAALLLLQLFMLYFISSRGSKHRSFSIRVANTTSHYPVANTTSHYPVANTTSHYQVANTTSHYPVANTTSHYPVANTTSHYPVANTTSHYPVANTTSHYPVANTTSHYPEGLTKIAGNKKTGATFVLIVTYMRSGSSLTGDILQQATNSFYLYEPMRYFQVEKYVIEYVNGSVRSPPFDLNGMMNDVIVSSFTCEMEKLPKGCLTAEFMKRGRKSKTMPECLHKYNSSRAPDTVQMRLCGHELKKVCLNSPVRIIKTIRMELKSVSHLLETLPNMKILHLVRDPRATLNSRNNMGACPGTNGGLLGCTERYCKRVEDDVLEEERLLKLYPDRIKPVFYEDIAKYPIESSKKMFDFIGETFTKEARDYIFNITMAGNKDGCVTCSARSNSSEHIDAWKKTMDPDFVKIAQERCNYILKRYKFELIEMNKSNQSLMKASEPL